MRVVTYGFGMRSPVWRVGAALAVLIAALAVGGCVEDEPDPTQSPDPSPSPLFESDEEALAAAEEAYGRYLRAVDAALQSGGRDTDLLVKTASGEALNSAQSDVSDFAANGLRTIGDTRINAIILQSIDAASITVYVCEDVSGVDLLDSTGVSIVSPDRMTLTSFEVALEQSGVMPELIVQERTVWEGESVCV
jgi:hypothetical protein